MTRTRPAMVPFHLIFVLLAVFCVSCSSWTPTFLSENFPRSVVEDSQLNTVQLLHKYKYPAETHYAVTPDSYILCMHRVPNPGKRPVFLMHGLLCSSSMWLMTCPFTGLAYYLHDLGYDVWMGNARGNQYSRNHTSMDPDRNQDFWDFSWHEIGVFDLPTMIDYVLLTTNHRRLSYIGHSQGTTAFWVMASMQPHYNDKIWMMSALAPVAFMKHMTFPLKDIVAETIPIIKPFMKEFLPHTNMWLEQCYGAAFTEDMCSTAVWLAMGKETMQTNRTMLPVLLGHIPAGCSIKQVEHYIQLARSDRFRMFDYGAAENQRRYGSRAPPDYPLDKITAPVGLYYTKNDFLASVQDVKRLQRSLPNVVVDKLIPFKQWNHITMVWGTNAREVVYKPMVEAMSKYECAQRANGMLLDHDARPRIELRG